MKYYLTTPIYYVNAAPHIGHTYTTLAADTIKRLKRMQGYEAVLTTGTDEHGQKVERSAQAMGKSPADFATVISNEFRGLWDRIGIQYDHFIRTTEPRHHETVKWLFDRCQERGYIYKGSYTGQYCVPDETFHNDLKPGDPCPVCGRPTETVTEENYFFKLSAFTDKLLKFYDDNPDFILPEARRNEVLAFVRGGLQDLSVSRTTIQWGIPIEGKHVVYVWFDALTNYLSVAKDKDESLWPADLHLVGKEIARFHAVFWPAFLMAADLPLPKRVFAHGWLLFENDKMSKSRGNIVRTDPIREVMGIEALRYFLFREVVFGQDGTFSYDALVTRYNSELANGLGNLASRTLTMIRQYRDGVIPGASAELSVEHPLALAARNAIDTASRSFDAFEFSKGLEAIWSMLSEVDRFIVEQAPWKLAKQPDAAEQLNDALYACAETLRIAVALLYPVLPESTANIWSQLGMTADLATFELAKLGWGQLAPGQAIGVIAPVFPRIEAKSAIDRMRALEEVETARQAKLFGKEVPAKTEEAASEGTMLPPSPKIEFDDFAKVDIRVGKVLTAERVKGADKLLHLTVDIGEPEPRTIVAGIALAYQPEQMVGRKVAIVANLHPRKLRGIESNGMIVAASLEGAKPVLAGFLEDVPVGARLK